MVTALNACMSIPASITVNDLINKANQYAAGGDNDPTTSMRNDRVFILTGTQDSTVVPGMFLEHYAALVSQ